MRLTVRRKRDEELKSTLSGSEFHTLITRSLKMMNIYLFMF